MLAIMPHHKGTDKLHADLRRKIAKFTEEAERRVATGRRATLYIKREGAGQVALAGLPNTGKSLLLTAVTEASPEVAEYPFTTKIPTPGMMSFENIQIQLIDTPPITDRGLPLWLTNLFRNADVIAIVVDLSSEPVTQVETTIQELIKLGIGLVGRDYDEPLRYRKKIILIGNKIDLDNSNIQQTVLSSRYQRQFPIVFVSAKDGTGLETLRKEIFKALDIIRVYTKTPGRKPDLTEPVILKKGSIIEDAAESIHKDFKNKLKYALVWGSAKFDGQRARRDHVLKDGDVIEFHI